MEHRALALQYRPQRFDEIAGQDHVTKVLSRALANGRVHHCYLFSGPRGVGKTTTARILAKILNCPDSKDGKPCNQCHVCRDITAGVSLDVQEIDGASNRGIADVQDLREKVRFTPSGGHYRVVIIDEVHQLSNDAFAALLKTLEEPPPHVVFIFATTDPLKLPDTIRSRCQRYDFGRLPMSAIVERLKEIAVGESKNQGKSKIALSDEAAFLLARKSEGSMRDAISSLDQILSTGVTSIDENAVNEVLGLVSREVFFELGEKILGREPEAALGALHQAYRNGVDPRDLAEGMLDHLRSLLVLRVDPRAEDLVAASEGERARFDAQGAEHDTPDLLRLMRVVSEALGAMRDSAQPLTHLEVAVVEMASLEPGVRLSEILERLGVLEDGGPSGKGGGSGGGSGGGKTAKSTRTGVATAKRRATGTGKKTAAETDTAAVIPGFASLVSTIATPGKTGAVAPSAPPVAALERTQVDARWDEVVRRVKEQKIMVGVFLGESRRVGWQGSVIQLAADEIHKSLLEGQENRELLARTMSDVYGREVRVSFVDQEMMRTASEETPSTPATGETEAPIATMKQAPGEVAAAPAIAPSPANGKASAAISPAVEQAMVWFEGEIVRQTEPGRADK